MPPMALSARVQPGQGSRDGLRFRTMSEPTASRSTGLAPFRPLALLVVLVALAGTLVTSSAARGVRDRPAPGYGRHGLPVPGQRIASSRHARGAPRSAGPRHGPGEGLRRDPAADPGPGRAAWRRDLVRQLGRAGPERPSGARRAVPPARHRREHGRDIASRALGDQGTRRSLRPGAGRGRRGHQPRPRRERPGGDRRGRPRGRHQPRRRPPPAPDARGRGRDGGHDPDARPGCQPPRPGPQPGRTRRSQGRAHRAQRHRGPGSGGPDAQRPRERHRVPLRQRHRDVRRIRIDRGRRPARPSRRPCSGRTCAGCGRSRTGRGT